MIFKLTREVFIKNRLSFNTGFRQATLMTLRWEDTPRMFPDEGRLEDYDGKPIQRTINKARVKKLAAYLEERILSGERFTLPPIVISVLPREPADLDEIGKVLIPFNNVEDTETLPPGTIVVVNDGQHRVEALKFLARKARKKTGKKSKTPMYPELNSKFHVEFRWAEISAMVLTPFMAEDMQQIFADINANAAKPSKSVTLFFDKANAFNSSVSEVIQRSEVLRDRTDIQKNVCSGKSPNVFTVATVTAAVRAFYPEKGKAEALTDKEINHIVKVFDFLSDMWFTDEQFPPEYLRENSLAPHSVFMQGLMVFMRSFIRNHVLIWEQSALTIPTQRRGAMINRCVDTDGSIIAGAVNVRLVAAMLKQLNSIQLTDEELQAEHALDMKLKTIADMQKARGK